MVLTIGSIHCCVFIIIMLSDKQSIFVFRSMAFEGVGAFEIDKRTFILELIFTLLPKSQIRIISISERKKKLDSFCIYVFLGFYAPYNLFIHDLVLAEVQWDPDVLFLFLSFHNANG